MKVAKRSGSQSRGTQEHEEMARMARDAERNRFRERRLGVAAETVTRWLSGALIQSRAMDDFMRLYFGLPEVRAALEDVGAGNPGQKQLRRAR